MEYRRLGKTDFKVSEVSLGTWQVGGKWGSSFDEHNAENILHSAIDKGVNFIDTADVYSEGQSEIAVGKAIRNFGKDIYVATKCGRQIQPHINEGYTPQALRKYVESSLKRLRLETIDLIQLHCPPTEVYYRPEIFGLFKDLKQEGKIRHLGVSVEKVEEALKAIEYSNVTTIQIIFNVFRQRPAKLFFKEAKKKDIGIIVRVPLASGLLTGMYNENTSFDSGDHRFFNRNGDAFDKGETFSGIDYSLGLQAMDELKKLFPGQSNLAAVALQWILQFNEVSCVIPGASRPSQVDSNLSLYALPLLAHYSIHQMNKIYENQIKNSVHHLW